MRAYQIAFLILSLVVFLPAQETRWRAAFDRVDLTPDEPIHLAGYASRDKPFESVEAPIFGKAVALTDSGAHRAVLITTDLIGFSAAVVDPICERIIGETGIERADILINSSHIHTGPSLTLDPADQGGEAQVEYTKNVQKKIADLAIRVLKEEGEPVVLSRGEGVVNFVMNRREWTAERGVILGVNPSGPVDRSVPVLKIAKPGEDGEILGVVFQAACHNTTFGGRFYGVTGDFAGYAQAYIELKLDACQAMFMTGCGGDANPYPKDDSMLDSKQHGQELGGEVLRVLSESDELDSVEGPLKTAFSKAELPLEPLPEKRELAEWKLKHGGWRGWVADQMGRYHEPGSEPFPSTYAAPMGVWQFGGDLTLVGLSGEVVFDYVPLLQRRLGYLNLWISAYCNEVYGYLPSARVLDEGGYETRGLYKGVGFFTPEVETVVADTIEKLVEEARTR